MSNKDESAKSRDEGALWRLVEDMVVGAMNAPGTPFLISNAFGVEVYVTTKEGLKEPPK